MRGVRGWVLASVLGAPFFGALAGGCAIPSREEPIELHFRGLGLPPLSYADRGALLYEELDLDEEPSSEPVEVDYFTANDLWIARMRHAEEMAPVGGPGPDLPVEVRAAREEYPEPPDRPWWRPRREGEREADAPGAGVLQP